MHVHLILPALLVLLFAFNSRLLVSAAESTPALSAVAPAPHPTPKKECSSKRDFCAVTHDGEFMQYRECCEGLACVAHDSIEREVTDVVSVFCGY